MSDEPNLSSRLWARVRGEVSGATLEAYRRAGGAVLELMTNVEQHRLEHRVAGQDPWSIEPNHQAMFLAAWNAFFLQTMGDKLLSADYETDTRTVGFVPPITAEQALRFYASVEVWLSRARQAEANPNFRLTGALPNELPLWVEVEPCPRAHLSAMRATAEVARLHTEATMQVFTEQAPGTGRSDDIARLRQGLSAANTSAEYAEGFIGGGSVTAATHETIETHLKDALDGYYRLGQLLAMPSLLSAPAPIARSGGAEDALTPVDVARLPGSVGFDVWVLTDPRTVARWKQERKARKAVDQLWSTDPAPGKTLAIQREIDLALGAGDIHPAAIGNYFCCPWAPIYDVANSVTIGATMLRPRQQFTFDVSGEELGEGGEFKREILVATFQPSKTVDYCLPGEDDDD